MKILLYVIGFYLLLACEPKNSDKSNDAAIELIDPTASKEEQTNHQAGNPTIDQGQETTNGDWSYGVRAKQRFLNQHFKMGVNISRFSLDRLLEEVSNKEALEILHNLGDLETKLYLGLRKFESFDNYKDYLNHEISGENFRIREDGKIVPELDFFFNFGAGVPEFKEAILNHQLRLAILDVLLLNEGITDHSMRQLLSKAILISMSEIVLPEELNKLAKGMDDPSTLIKLKELIKTEVAFELYHLIFDHFAFKYNIALNELSFKMDDSIDLETVSCFIDEFDICLENKDKNNNIMSWKQKFSYEVKKGNQVLEKGSSFSYQTLLLESSESGIFQLAKIKSRIEEMSTVYKLLEPSFDVVLNHKALDLQVPMFRDLSDSLVAKKKFDAAVTELLSMLNESSSDGIQQELNPFITNSRRKAQKEFGKEWLESHIQSIDHLNKKDDLSKEKLYTIKNMNYHADFSGVYLTPTFYMSFGVKNHTVFEKFEEKRQIQLMILNEILHLAGINDEYSMPLAELLLKKHLIAKGYLKEYYHILPIHPDFWIEEQIETKRQQKNQMIRSLYFELKDVVQSIGVELRDVEVFDIPSLQDEILCEEAAYSETYSCWGLEENYTYIFYYPSKDLKTYYRVRFYMKEISRWDYMNSDSLILNTYQSISFDGGYREPKEFPSHLTIEIATGNITNEVKVPLDSELLDKLKEFNLWKTESYSSMKSYFE